MVTTAIGLKISLKSCKSKGKPGTPDFPGKIIRVALPKNTKAMTISEEIVRISSLTKSLQLVTCVQDTGFVFLDENNEPVTSGDPFHQPNMAVYQEVMKSPEPVVKLINTEWIDDIPMAVLEVIPVRYVKNGTSNW